MPRYYPIFLDIEGRVCLVVGGGAVAERKVSGLLEAGARVRVVSPALTPGLRALADAGDIEAILSPYAPAFLSDACLVFAATDDRQVNAQVAMDARELHLPMNVADAPEESRFVVPSVVRRGEFCLAISTGGNHPMLAARLGDEMEIRFGPEYGAFVELLGQMRSYIKQQTSDVERRRRAAACLLDAEAELRALLRAEPPEAALARAQTLVADLF